MAFGTRHGQYEILAALGAGGMGEVYRARDTKLKRDVALKVLPEAFSSDPERMARFQREAEVLASLNHPNIAHIYGVEDQALVMELVEGESPKGPMSFEDAWKIAMQIADALEYAHERGIVHRDLKPGNVKVTPEGVVKLLDFGLAKAFSGQDHDGQVAGRATDSPTLTLGATVAGVVMGTAAYMAPEQAKGKRVDKRADIWSWGVVLYELLSGGRLFQGDEVADTLAQVLTKEPDFNRVPPRVRKLLSDCLEKDPKKRLRDIGDARRLLEEPATERQPAPSLPLLGIVASISAGVLLVALGILSFVHFRETPQQTAMLRFRIAAPERANFFHSFAISPNGRYIAISAPVNGKQQLWLRALDALQAQPIPGTDAGAYPFWSPDSRSIGFFAESKLKKIAVSGGPSQALCDVAFGAGGSWNRDNVIVFSSGSVFSGGSGRIQRVSAFGGTPGDVPGTKASALFPLFLPDGRQFLYLVRGESVEQSGVYLHSLDGKPDRRVLADQSSVILAAGRLLFIRGDTLMAQPFETSSGQIAGESFPVAEGVSAIGNGFFAPVTASDTGTLVYESGGTVAGGDFQIGLYNRGGERIKAIGGPGRVFEPTLSPDEKSVLFRRISASGTDLWLWDVVRGTERRLTTDNSSKFAPVWSPKGDRIAFASTHAGSYSGRVFDLYQKAINGTGQDELLIANGNSKMPSQWSQDGRFLVYSENDPKTKNDVWVLPMDRGAERKLQAGTAFLHSEFNELHGQLSPDSHWMAYTSDRTGRREVYVVSFPTGEGETRISINGGEQPRWRGDGKELFYLGEDGSMMVVVVNARAPSGLGNRPPFEPGSPQPLFRAYTPVYGRSTVHEYDVTADGKRFLVDSAGGGGSASVPQLTVVSNYDVFLKK